jgi:NAD(P)-dependent dehydrogenase (short-subunit alcohol dehydrogenase family)
MTSALDFDPGVAIVAGGSGGIGAGICRRFAASGIPLVFTYHSSEDKARALNTELLEAGGRSEYERVDLTVAAEVHALFARVHSRHERIAHVIYAAGPHFEFNFIGAIPDADWHRVVNADLNGAFNLIQGAVRCFRTQGTSGGTLTAVITSAVERFPIKDAMSAAPKAAIEVLIRGVAKESGRFGIRANCVGPGWVNVGMGKAALQDKFDDKTRENTRRQVPLQRFGEAEDIAWAVLFLASRQSSYISGQSLAVDGGLQL